MKRNHERELHEEFGLRDLMLFLKRSMWPIILFLASSTVFTIWQFEKSPSYTAHGLLTIETAKSDPMQAVAHKIAGLSNGTQDESDRATEKYLMLFESGNFLDDVAQGMILGGKGDEFLSYLPGPKKTVEIGSAALAEEIIEVLHFEKYAPETIKISATLPTRESAVAVMNIVLESFQSAMIERESKDISAAKKFLEEQLTDVESRLGEIDAKVLEYQRNTMDLRQKAKISNSEPTAPITSLERALIDLRLELQETESLMKEFTGGKSNYSPIDKYGAASSFENLQRKRDLIKMKIRSSAKMLAELMDAEKARPHSEREIEDLYKRKELEYMLFSDLKKEIMTLDIQKISTQNKVKILEQALLSSTHASQSLNSAIAKRGVLALAVACFTVFLWEISNPVVRNRKDLNGFRISYLGAMPRINQQRRRGLRGLFSSRKKIKDNIHVLDIEPDSYYDMIFKNIRARVMNFELPEGKLPQVISVMSPSSGEGKTSMASNLARSLSMSGKRVLLVDADIRKRSLTKALHYMEEVGFAEYLERPLEQHTKPLVKNISKYLDMLPAGQYSPHSSELIASKNFVEFVEAMRYFYDYVVLDTPPALPFPEVIPMAKASDMVVVSILTNRTKIDFVEEMLEKLQFSSATPVGYVLNKSKHAQILRYYPSSAPEHRHGAAA